MEYGYESDKSDQQIVDEESLHEIRNRLLEDPHIPETFLIGEMSIDTRDLAEDQRQFEIQQKQLFWSAYSSLAVQLKANAWPREGEDLLAVVDLYGMDQNYDVARTEIVLKEAGLDVTALDPRRAEEIFADRVAETIALRAAGSGGPGLVFAPPSYGGMDTVSSRYDGDDIICAKGWFLSTRTIIGQSACPLNLPKGRYSLGVVSHGNTHFHPELWSLPVGRHVHLLLP